MKAPFRAVGKLLRIESITTPLLETTNTVEQGKVFIITYSGQILLSSFPTTVGFVVVITVNICCEVIV